MSSLIWKLHLDDFLFSSSPAHLKLELELFEIDDIVDDDDDDDDDDDLLLNPKQTIIRGKYRGP